MFAKKLETIHSVFKFLTSVNVVILMIEETELLALQHTMSLKSAEIFENCSMTKLNLLSFPVAVFKNPVCKVYRFQTTDSKWMLVREQMAECTLSFSIPIQLLQLYIQEDRHRYVSSSS